MSLINKTDLIAKIIKTSLKISEIRGQQKIKNFKIENNDVLFICEYDADLVCKLKRSKFTERVSDISGFLYMERKWNICNISFSFV